MKRSSRTDSSEQLEEMQRSVRQMKCSSGETVCECPGEGYLPMQPEARTYNICRFSFPMSYSHPRCHVNVLYDRAVRFAGRLSRCVAPGLRLQGEVFSRKLADARINLCVVLGGQSVRGAWP